MIDHTWYQRPPGVPERLSAGGLVVRRTNSAILVALAREIDQPHYFLPKGGVKPDETDLHAAQREIAEEIGLQSLTLLADLGVRERLSSNKKRWTRCRYFLFRTDQVDGHPTDPRRRYTPPNWFMLDNIPPMLWPEQFDLIQSNRQPILAALAQQP